MKKMFCKPASGITQETGIKPTNPATKKKPKTKKPASDQSTSGITGSFFALEPRIMFDGAAVATGAEVLQDTTTQDQTEIPGIDGETTTDSTSTDSSDSEALWSSGLSLSAPSDRKEIVFIDTRVEDYQTLMEGIDPNAEVILLDSTREGVEQIAEALNGRTDIDAIHLISHGTEGVLNLGTSALTLDTMMGEYADELSLIKQTLSEEADLLIYGCNFAQGDSGQAAVTLLAELTGADVAASTDKTGAQNLGGDWELEAQTGSIETNLVVNETIQGEWNSLLAETWRDAATGAIISGPSSGDQIFIGDSANNSPSAAGGGNDTMYGGAGDDTFYGGSGNDVLIGGEGNDTLTGDSGDDVILGGAGNDQLFGGSATTANVLISGGGNDTMTGGTGSDIFRFTGAQSGDVITVNGDAGTDTIDLSEFASATITDNGSTITVDRGGGDIFTINYSNIETIITSASGGNHGPVAEAGPDQTVATSSLVTLTAAGSSDQDGDTLTYQWIQIEGDTWVTLNNGNTATPTFTAPASTGTLSFVVVVSDGTTSHADTVTITVSNNSAPVITSDGGGTTASLSLVENSTAVTTVTATDADADTVTYSISGGLDAAKFSINSSTGELTFVSAPDYAVPADSNGDNVYEVIVQVSDGNGGTDSQTLNVTVTSEEPIGHWTFDADATDSSGNNYDGTLTNGASIDTTDATNIVGAGKLSLDGTNDYVDLTSHLVEFTSLTEGTISAWIKTTSTSGVIFASNDIADTASGTVLWVNSSGQLEFLVFESNVALLQVHTNVTVNDGTWHQVAVTNGTSGNILYIDGVQATVTYTAGNSATDRFFDDVTGEDTLFIGRDQRSGGSLFFNGTIDDVRVYNRVLTGSDVDALFTTSGNHSPVNTVPGAQTVDEDTPLAVSGISVNDTEGNLSTVQLSVSNGTLDVRLSGSATISAGANGRSTLTLSGSQADINASLASLTYQGDLNFNGSDTLTVTSTDTNSATDTDTIAITVTSINDAPVNTVPGAQAVTEDTPLSITGVSVTDVDDNLSTV
ncbi:MAG: DUF4347 domain-containing protein, partial [Nitrospira sp.]|nr:DUF4347 domain-containing protein [Nitrospira sp.]